MGLPRFGSGDVGGDVEELVVRQNGRGGEAQGLGIGEEDIRASAPRWACPNTRGFQVLW